jgi:geranylgeranyl pyrophosphate synthase
MGKETFQDIREGKVTLPMIFLLKKLNDGNHSNEIDYVREVYYSKDFDRSRISEMIKKFEIEEEVMRFSKKYLERASRSLPEISSKNELYLILEKLTSLIA